MLLGYGYLGFCFFVFVLFFFFFGFFVCFFFFNFLILSLRMPRMLGGRSQFFWGQNQICHRFTQITITPPIITQCDSNREGMVPRMRKEPIQKEKESHFWANNYCTKNLSKKKNCPKKKVIKLKHRFRKKIYCLKKIYCHIFLQVLIHEFGLKLDA